VLQVLLVRKIEKSANDDGDALQTSASATTDMIFSSPMNSDHCQDRQIVDEATEWLMSSEDRECTALRDGAGQPEGFLNWLNRSPEHIRVFLEVSHAHYSLCGIDAQYLVEPEKTVNSGGQKRSNVVSLRAPRPVEVDDSWLQAVETVTSRRQPVSLQSRWVVASVLVAIAIGAATWLPAGSSKPAPWTNVVSQPRSESAPSLSLRMVRWCTSILRQTWSCSPIATRCPVASGPVRFSFRYRRIRGHCA
jgi:hypothetical protein